jgi:hypothetical protein
LTIIVLPAKRIIESGSGYGIRDPFLPLNPGGRKIRIRDPRSGRGRGVLNCVGDHILQEFNTLFLTRFRTYRTNPNKNL